MENKETIITALRTLFEPGDVFEIRILDAVLPNSNWPHIESGYFDYDHIETVPNALANFKTYGGVYVTLNPVNPDLLARANNRFRKARSRETTSDQDILRRRWLLIDIDPVRPAGISATDAEHNLSFDTAMKITGELASRGFPRPMCVSSGNGTQMLYRIEIPRDDNGLVQNCLLALSPCSTDQVHIDLSVHNPARICRLPGTWNRKGDSTDTRPHRIAKILDKPDKMEIVSTVLLHKLAESISETSTTPVHKFQPMANDGEVISTGNVSSPIDDFNQRGDLKPILEKHGWQMVGETQDNQLWRRPGKTSGNHSATFNGETFYVFSSNAAPFEAGRGYSRFGVYAMLEYNGDDSVAINALKAQGYGSYDSDVDLSGLLANCNKPMEPLKDSASSFTPSPADRNNPAIEIKPLGPLIHNFTGLNKPIIHGLLREGETMNVIASPKVGKSWFAMRLAISVASGLDWLGFPVEQGRVLHIDNELFENTLIDRYQKVSEAMNIKHTLYSDHIDIVSLRGKLQDLVSLGRLFEQIGPNQYKLVILDAFYRTLPSGTDENDNGAIANIYNLIDHYAAQLGCGFVLIHHSSKGNQSGKSVTDVGAGAGSQSRAADTHLVLRPHEEEGIFVMESAIRSFAPVEPIALQWNWPLFTRTDMVDTSALLGLEKPKAKTKDIALEQFVQQCIAEHDPCSKRVIRYESARQFNLSEHKSDEMLELAIEQNFVVKICVGSTMKYVVNRPDFVGEKALLVAAILTHNPEANTTNLADSIGVSKRYINQIKAESEGSWAGRGESRFQKRQASALNTKNVTGDEVITYERELQLPDVNREVGQKTAPISQQANSTSDSKISTYEKTAGNWTGNSEHHPPSEGHAGA